MNKHKITEILKKIIAFCVVTIFMLSCKSNTVSITGLLEGNNALKKITLGKGSETIKEIAINANQNTFKFSIENLKKGYYKLNKTLVYLAPGFNLKLDFTQDTVRFKGKGANENRLLQLRINQEKEYNPESKLVTAKYTLKTDAFKSYLKGISSKFNKQIDNKPLDKAFIATEKRRIIALTNAIMEKYIYEHGANSKLQQKAFDYYSSSDNPESPNIYKVYDSLIKIASKDEFPAPVKEQMLKEVYLGFDINDEQLYLSNSLGYRLLLDKKIGGDAFKLKFSINNSNDYSKPIGIYKQRVIIDSIKNRIIKNDLLTGITEQIIMSEPKYADKSYNLFIKSTPAPSKKQLDEVTNKYNKLKKLKRGISSAVFVNYRTPNDKTVSLKDFSGKFVYIDIWATWCGPCIKEIPSLKKIEKKYHSKNIVFISISVDVEKQRQKWKDMVANMQLSGVQIMADKSFKSDFISAYNIVAIPRFILIDTKGAIISANAPRPSDPRLIELFNELKI